MLSIFDLREVQFAAKTSDMEYASTKVQNDIGNLGYTFEDVANCICQLTPENFHTSHDYTNVKCDAYKIQYKLADSDREDDLYIKLRLIGKKTLLLDLMSFHLQQ
jgi:hypothetical protein